MHKKASSFFFFISIALRVTMSEVASKCFWERLLRLRIRWLWVIGSCFETLVTAPLPLLGSHNNNNDDEDDNEDVDDDDDDDADDNLHVIQSN